MRVYLIAAPEDEAEAEKLAEHLRKFGVFIRAEYGRMAYPPAHSGEYTLALWSRNAMMSSRQMMLTNRAIDAWENGQLVMARLEHGLNPRGLGDLEMVDLTFPAARQHRYHDVLNALRAMEDDRRAALRQEAEAASLEGQGSVPAAGAMDMAMSAPMESAPDATVEAPSPKRRAAPAAASARSRGFPILTISLLVLLIAGAGGVFLLMNVTVSSDRAAMEPVVSEEVLDPPQTDPTDVAAEDPADSESGPDLDIAPGTRSIITAESPIAESPASIRTEITRLEEAIVFERRALAAMQAAPDGRDEALIQQRQVIDRLQLDLAEMRSIEREQLNQFESETAGTPAIASEPSLLDRFQRMNGPVLWAIAAALFGLIVLLLMMARRKSSRTAKQASDMTPEVPDAPAAPEPPIVPPTPVLDSGHDAFVSYSHSNAETVLPIVQSIEEDGITVWIDRDEMRAGQTWAGQIVRAIKSADQFCLMCSAQAFESDHVRREVYLADKYGKKMVPIRLDATEMPEDIEYFLIGRQWIDLFEVAEEDRLKAIKSLLSESED